MNLFKNISIVEEIGVMPNECKGIALDSRKVDAGFAFIAIRGYVSDGHNYIQTAIDKQASIIICEEFPKEILSDVYYVKVRNTSEIVGVLAANYYDNPSTKINVIGVTGTNGKTTIVTLLYNLFTELGYFCGLISTVKYLIGDEEANATHTTPDAITLNKMLAEMVNKGCEYCFMEVSSHAMVQNRVNGIRFRGGVFTNITHDHLDFHQTFDSYIKAKKAFFDNLEKGAFALTNVDDKNGSVMTQSTKADVYTYSLKTLSDFKAKILELDIYGSLVDIDGVELWLPIPAVFNIYNQLAVYGVAKICGIKDSDLNVAITKIKGAAGRFQVVDNKTSKPVIVDYAHTPDALDNVLKTLKDFKNYDKIYCVFGAGGDRDKTKRPEMAEVALKYADVIIVTSDNPRTENPQSIIDDIVVGVNVADMKKVICNPDRYSAIKTALTMMTKDDITLIAGKGHETYQEINGIRHHFDDVEVVKEILNI